MKGYYRILIYISTIFLLCIGACFLILSKSDFETVDIVELNDITKSAGDSMDNLTRLSNMVSDIEEANSSIRNKLVITITAAALMMLLGMGIYGLYVRNSIIKPFERMQEFSQNVAAGDLDFRLNMEKDNMFGSFTESFDIMKEELKKSRKRENDLKKKEKELIAQLSHDLKTPITGIKLTSELLKVKVKDEYIFEKINNIYEKADQIDAMVNDLFASTLSELGQLSVSCQDVEADILSDIVKRQDDNNLVTLGEVPECLINIDVRRMEQIIANIIGNSYKYANTKIDVNFALSKGYLRMDIRDYGPGAEADEIHLLTNKFYRGRSENVQLNEGSGLGLHISRMLIEMMNGELVISSDGGFVVSLMIALS